MNAADSHIRDRGTAGPVRMVLIEPQPLMLDAMSNVLGAIGVFDVVAAAVDADEVFGPGATCPPAELCVLGLDANLRASEARDLVKRVSRATPRGMRTVVFSARRDAELMLACLDAGAVGFVHSTLDPTQLSAALIEASSGIAVLGGPDTRSRLAALRQSRADALLSLREREILREVAAGRTNAQAAEALYVSAETVKTSMSRIFDKLGVRDRTSAVLRAREAGLI